MSSLEKFISEEFKVLKLYGTESEHILTIELCDDLYTSDVQYINKCYDKAIKIFECINYEEDEIFIVANIYKEKNYNHIENLNIKRYLKNKKVLKTLNCIFTDGKDVESSVVNKEEYINHYYLNCETKDLNYKKFILDLCRHDLSYKVKAMHDYFIINKNKKICYRMMDDRFVDLIFNDLEFDKEKWINMK